MSEQKSRQNSSQPRSLQKEKEGKREIKDEPRKRESKKTRERKDDKKKEKQKEEDTSQIVHLAPFHSLLTSENHAELVFHTEVMDRPKLRAWFKQCNSHCNLLINGFLNHSDYMAYLINSQPLINKWMEVNIHELYLCESSLSMIGSAYITILYLQQAKRFLNVDILTTHKNIVQKDEDLAKFMVECEQKLCKFPLFMEGEGDTDDTALPIARQGKDEQWVDTKTFIEDWEKVIEELDRKITILCIPRQKKRIPSLQRFVDKIEEKTKLQKKEYERLKQQKRQKTSEKTSSSEEESFEINMNDEVLDIYKITLSSSASSSAAAVTKEQKQQSKETEMEDNHFMALSVPSDPMDLKDDDDRMDEDKPGEEEKKMEDAKLAVIRDLHIELEPVLTNDQIKARLETIQQKKQMSKITKKKLKKKVNEKDGDSEMKEDDEKSKDEKSKEEEQEQEEEEIDEENSKQKRKCLFDDDEDQDGDNSDGEVDAISRLTALSADERKCMGTPRYRDAVIEYSAAWRTWIMYQIELIKRIKIYRWDAPLVCRNRLTAMFDQYLANVKPPPETTEDFRSLVYEAHLVGATLLRYKRRTGLRSDKVPINTVMSEILTRDRLGEIQKPTIGINIQKMYKNPTYEMADLLRFVLTCDLIRRETTLELREFYTYLPYKVTNQSKDDFEETIEYEVEVKMENGEFKRPSIVRALNGWFVIGYEKAEHDQPLVGIKCRDFTFAAVTWIMWINKHYEDRDEYMRYLKNFSIKIIKSPDLKKFPF